jgi:hypothetical protein
MRTWMIATVALVGGCTNPNPGSLVTLDGPAVLYAWGPTAESRIEARRQGPIDPEGHVQTIPVTDARLTLDLGDQVGVTRLALTLADVDLPESRQLPDGLSVRAQTLELPAAAPTTTEARDYDSLKARVDGTMRYHAALPISSGLYPLGATDVTGTLEIDVHPDASGRLNVWLHATPSGTCGEIGSVMTLSECALDVQLTGVNTIEK